MAAPGHLRRFAPAPATFANHQKADVTRPAPRRYTPPCRTLIAALALLPALALADVADATRRGMLRCD